MKRSHYSLFLFFLLIFFSLSCLRMQLVLEENLSWQGAINSGVFLGLYYDAAFSFLAVALSLFLYALFRIPFKFTLGFFSLLLFVGNLANVLYYRFFGLRLDWWVVEFHIKDLTKIGGAPSQLAVSFFVITAGFLFLVAGVFLCKLKIGFHESNRSMRSRLKFALQSTLLLGVFFLWRQSPVWFKWNQESNVANDQIIQTWYYQNFQRYLFSGWGPEKSRNYNLFLNNYRGEHPSQMLAAFRDFKESEFLKKGSSYLEELKKIQKSSDWPLLREFAPNPKIRRALLDQLGVRSEHPHVVLLVVESLRYYEYARKDLALEVYPKLHALMKKHGILFSQAYSSSIAAGLSARGQFSSICSSLPNFMGPATFLAFSTLRIRCLPSFLLENNYQTHWMSTLGKEFHNVSSFESLNGMENFHDYAYFKDKNIPTWIGGWGLADGPYLEESVLLMNELAKKDPSKPLYAELVTVSTHTPVVKVPGVEFSPELEKKLEGVEYFRNYLSMYCYEDDVLDDFFKKLFDSPIGDDVVVLVMGDHSHKLTPEVKLNIRQLLELESRIFMGIISKNMKNPEIRDYPVHQMDAAPTLALLAGGRGRVTWLGKGLFNEGGEGSPWLHLAEGNILTFRTASNACYQQLCYHLLKGEDPLFQETLTQSDVAVPLVPFFKEVIEANGAAIGKNLILPKEANAN